MSKAENPFRYFNSSPEVIRLVALMYVRFLLSLRNVEDLLFERPSGGQSWPEGWLGLGSLRPTGEKSTLV
jgi:putative transposase